MERAFTYRSDTFSERIARVYQDSRKFPRLQLRPAYEEDHAHLSDCHYRRFRIGGLFEYDSKFVLLCRSAISAPQPIGFLWLDAPRRHFRWNLDRLRRWMEAKIATEISLGAGDQA